MTTTDADTLRMLGDAAKAAVPFDAKRVRALRGAAPSFDRHLWAEMAEQGWFSVLVPEGDGGLGLGLDAAARIAHAMGAAAAPEPFVAAGVVVPKLLSVLGKSDHVTAVLDKVMSGEALACVAAHGPSGELAVGATAVLARSSGDGYSLSGELRFVPVPDADAFIVPVVLDLAEGDAEPQLCESILLWVETDGVGIEIERETNADGSASGWVRFTNAGVPGSAKLAGGDFWPHFEEACDAGTIANCAELLGNMERCLDLTLEFIKTRSQFGQQIGKFQVLQHRTVDLWMNKEVACHVLTASLNVMMTPDVPASARAQAASSAKARIGQVALALGNDAIQLHGAIGFTDEYDLALYVNRAITIAPYLGNAADHLKRYGELKQRQVEVPA